MALEQRNIESYFTEHKITDPDMKVKMLPEITNLIYERNNALVRSERAETEDLKEGLLREAQEAEDKIQEVITDILKRSK